MNSKVRKLNKEINDLLNGLVTACSEDSGTACGRLAWMCNRDFPGISLDEKGVCELYDIQAMLIGARRSPDATEAQKPVLDVTLLKLEAYIYLLEGEDPAKLEQEISANFTAGKALACQLMRQGEDISNDVTRMDAVNFDSQYRGGVSFNNFALNFVEKLIAQPELAEGFAAVLSTAFGETDGVTPSTSAELSAVTYAQFLGSKPKVRKAAKSPSLETA